MRERWTYVVEDGGGGNPYTPKTEIVPDRPPSLPEARMWRTGVMTEGTLAIYRSWWDNLDGVSARARAIQSLALLDAEHLAVQVSEVSTLPAESAARVEAWARRQPDREIAAGLALAAERSRDEQRPGLVRKLSQIQ